MKRYTLVGTVVDPKENHLGYICVNEKEDVVWMTNMDFECARHDKNIKFNHLIKIGDKFDLFGCRWGDLARFVRGSRGNPGENIFTLIEPKVMMLNEIRQNGEVTGYRCYCATQGEIGKVTTLSRDEVLKLLENGLISNRRKVKEITQEVVHRVKEFDNYDNKSNNNELLLRIKQLEDENKMLKSFIANIKLNINRLGI